MFIRVRGSGSIVHYYFSSVLGFLRLMGLEGFMIWRLFGCGGFSRFKVWVEGEFWGLVFGRSGLLGLRVQGFGLIMRDFLFLFWIAGFTEFQVQVCVGFTLIWIWGLGRFRIVSGTGLGG